jgi:hypothetical protein
MKDIVIEIPGVTLPSWNKFYAGKHWAVRKKLADEWHMLVSLHAKAKEDGDKMATEPVDIEITCHFANKVKLLDADNICSKIAIDGLKGIFIQEDDPDYVKNVTTRSRLDRENPRTIIIIKDHEEESKILEHKV